MGVDPGHNPFALRRLIGHSIRWHYPIFMARRADHIGRLSRFPVYAESVVRLASLRHRMNKTRKRIRASVFCRTLPSPVYV